MDGGERKSAYYDIHWRLNFLQDDYFGIQVANFLQLREI